METTSVIGTSILTKNLILALMFALTLTPTLALSLPLTLNLLALALTLIPTFGVSLGFFFLKVSLMM